jgi:hypothetical protein
MINSGHLVHANFGAYSVHRFKVLRDVAQRSDSVSPRAHEYKPTAIEAPEVWPLELSPCFFKPRKRPPSFYVPLSHCAKRTRWIEVSKGQTKIIVAAVCREVPNSSH